MATKASRIALAGSNISSTGEVDADLLDNIDSAAFLSLDSNGRLGIGTASPDRALTIEGSDFASSSIRLKRTGGGANNDAGLQFQSAAGANAGAGMGGIWFQNSLDGNAYALIRARTDDVTGTSGRLDFMTGTSTVSNSTTPRMTIKSDGNVGIGTSTPRSKLQVVSGVSRLAGGSARFGKNDITGGLFLHSDASTASHYNWMITTQDTVNKGFEIIPSSAAGNTEFSNPAFVIIADTGNVGIGTTSPGKKLDVNGEARLTTGLTITPATSSVYATDSTLSSYATGNGVYLNGHANGWLRLNGSGANRASIDVWGENYAAPFGDSITFRTGNTADRMIIAASGNVGIGTTSPGEKLHVEGSIRASGNIGVTQTDGDYLAKLYQSSADGFLELYTGEATPVSRVKLSAYGDSYIAPSTTSGLGVGTTAPSERLHVVGDIQQQSTHNGSDRCVEAFFNIATNTSYNTVWTANINNQHQGMFYEVICYGGDWGSHSSARVIKRGFVNGYNGYSGHQEIESAGPYASNISGQLLWSSNTVTYQMRLDTGSVTLRGMVRLIGHFTGYTVY